MTTALRIALVKPDWGFRGGGEVAVDRTVGLLEAAGHRVERHAISIPDLPRRPFGLPVPDRVWDASPEFFRHLAVLAAVDRLDLSAADLVVSTQPPSYGATHDHHLSIFFHHLRVFYDLSEPYLAAGFALDPDLHLRAQARLREVDQERLDRVGWFCPISETVEARLRRFNGVTRSSVLHFGVGVGDDRPEGATAEPGRGEVLCVSRSEFPKRTELFVHALRHRPALRGVLVGTGGRLPWVELVERRLSERGADLDAVTPGELWCNRGEVGPEDRRAARPRRSNLRIAGRVDDGELLRLYRDAPCVVAPAYDEDYGLTALEAMAHGRPVVCCRDGGGLTAFVQDGVNGFVVEPTGPAIGDAVARIAEDPALARQLGEGALDTASQFTWARCATELHDAVDRVMDR